MKFGCVGFASARRSVGTRANQTASVALAPSDRSCQLVALFRPHPVSCGYTFDACRTALLFNARADWLDSYVDYEALKKAIPEPAPAAQRAVRPATSSYTDLEAAPLLRTAEAEVSSGGEIAKGHQPFFKLLDKELRKIANFYEDKERELLRAGEELDRDLREEEERDLERVKEESWDPADSGLEPVGDADENEGESHLGSLGGFANTHRKNRSRSRSRITSTASPAAC